MSKKAGFLSGLLFGGVTIAIAVSLLMPVYKEYVDNKARMHELVQDLGGFQREFAGLNREVANLKTELEEKNRRLSSLQDKQDEKEDVFGDLREKNAALQDICQAHQKELEMCGSEIKKLHRKIKKNSLLLAAMDKKRSEAVGFFFDLKKRDDEIIRCAVELTKGFMEIAVADRPGNQDPEQWKEHLEKMIDLSIRFENEKKSRDRFVKEIKKHI